MPTSATVIADTMGEYGARIITLEYEAPRCILAEINTHGVLAKSAASSRAIPIRKRIEMAMSDPFVPAQFGRNKPGMQSDEALRDDEQAFAREAWRAGRDCAVAAARALEALDTHKQQANRVLEPYVHVRGVLTGTEWDNFFALRDHRDADPAFRDLAAMAREVIGKSEPKHAIHHLPYMDRDGDGLSAEQLFKVSAVRCARVSYRAFDGKPSTIEADMALHDKLLGDPPHMSPFDHPALADWTVQDGAARRWANPRDHGRFWGWVPYRRQVERQLGYVSRRDSFAVIPASRNGGSA